MRILLTAVPAAALLLSGCGGGAVAEFGAVSLEARAAEARPVLKQAFTLQEAYRARNDRYAATFRELEEVGWEDPQGMRQYQLPRIVRAEGEALCMEMEPTRPDLWPQHVDQTGVVQRGRCP
ncbi:MAG: hypothetical protein KY467_10895 [Gemmatimonadetes bacterium]|nr:hypothetical protein [Gemmatimonadota bacterium]